MFAYDMAQARGGRFLLRIEDIDRSRARPEWESQIYDDLAWLGLTWDTPVLRQSDRLNEYQAVLDQLWARGLLYPCTCSRADIAAAASAPQEGAPLLGPDGVIYPGTCREKCTFTENTPRPDNTALRLNMEKALRLTGHSNASADPVTFQEACLPVKNGTAHMTGPDILHTVGDIVLARRDMGTSYHLSVVLDDAAQGVTDVIRGADLFEATVIHVLLQELLSLPTPVYHHHPLIRDDKGKRLAKRDDARAVSFYRAQGASPTDIRGLVGL
jgi:glutamyl-Q tRNA(Asp) synthetase